MKMFVAPPRVYLHRQFVDFRKSINGLSVIIGSELELPAMSGALFIFCNKARDKLKILYWDKTGFALWYKRLEKDKFKWPSRINEACLELNDQQLAWLLEGYDVIGHQEVSYQNIAL
jgi:transposase